ncbi:MAG: helix-turn-helix transcriptional regulator [Rhodobacteraceae bacterium]|nr:helix-turn-helix transcriptional regulator [Paracoccaceae bacterium]
MEDLAALVAALGTERFGSALMDVLHRRAGADMCSAFVVTEGRAAVLVAESTDRDASAFARLASLRYAQRYWRRDVAGLMTLGRAHRKVQVLKRPASSIRDMEYQHECYSDGDVVERLALYRHGMPSIIASAYRARSGGPFAPRHLAAFAEVAPLLHAIIIQHARAGAGVPKVPGDPAPLAAALARLAGLSAREAAVAAFLVSGFPIREIASLLRVTEATAVTYRRRAYSKLGVGNRGELRRRAMELS